MNNLRFKWQRFREIVSDPRYIPFLIQRRFVHPSTRERIADWVANRRPAAAFSGELGRGHAALLRENGIAHLGELLDDGEAAEVTAFLERCKVADPYSPDAEPFVPLEKERATKVHVAFHEPTDVIAAPHLLALANRSDLLAIAEAFLGCRPTIGYLASWWSFATEEAAQAAERFHRDVDDWRFLKLFVYLTDVGSKQGPHIYVQASASSDRLIDIRRFEDDEVAGEFGNNAIIVNTGKAGEGFIENTFGIHKGQPVEEGHRLIFQVVYSQSTLPYAPKRPIGDYTVACAHTGMNLDPYVNRKYII